MKSIFDDISFRSSKTITRSYSTSFSMGIYFLHRSIHDAIYSIYGFVRLADEIVDSFHGYDKEAMLQQIRKETQAAIDQKISINPVLNAFQHTVHNYQIEWKLIDLFLKSMEADLIEDKHNLQSFEAYILGSAEVVGLMCLRVFTNGNSTMYEHLKPAAMKLGSAFQKVNFLRDLKADYQDLGRSYFPDVDMSQLQDCEKEKIEQSILADFDDALIGIKQLPSNSKLGVYLAYIYYKQLFIKIAKLPANRIMNERVRISNGYKVRLMLNSIFKYQMNII
ncbi:MULTISPECIES: phytoene/squalene synthase family protein [Reichenbachiella]|uniref:Phytoene/squalene synthetase n=1 Tax=Reichenbachiella agariperforans TaxID=156994 RepID=A0A1M6K995_REIAG|nr:MULTISPECIES: phytoene/squalene synthase family protein [Reichenbachiella]RJE74564.1 phytoene synthase [Reichenbachiella sp. MSK19-1]SHJ55447.1 Phytoene/squalene synthetase [Reichenbachiella agariperforans]